MPPKKVAKKAAKKTAKHPNDALRRAYEHLQRLHLLQPQLEAATLEQVEILSRAAQSAMAAEDAKSAADLLRAAEHLAFGSLASEAPDDSVSQALAETAGREYEHLMERGAAQWAERDGSAARHVAATYKAMLASAKAAFKARAFHRSLEFARGAEALAHARTGDLGLKAPASSGRAALRSAN